MLHTLYNRYRDLKKGLSSWNVNASRVHVERSKLWLVQRNREPRVTKAPSRSGPDLWTRRSRTLIGICQLRNVRRLLKPRRSNSCLNVKRQKVGIAWT